MATLETWLDDLELTLGRRQQIEDVAETLRDLSCCDEGRISGMLNLDFWPCLTRERFLDAWRLLKEAAPAPAPGPKKKRGRPPKAPVAAEEAEAAPAPKPRGRPRKSPAVPTRAPAPEAAPKKRGRPPAAAAREESSSDDKAAAAPRSTKKKVGGPAAPGPVPAGAVQVITAGGRVATVLERKQRGWFAVELDGNPSSEGGAFERKAMRRPMFAPGQDDALNSAPGGESSSDDEVPPAPKDSSDSEEDEAVPRRRRVLESSSSSSDEEAAPRPSRFGRARQKTQRLSDLVDAGKSYAKDGSEPVRRMTSSSGDSSSLSDDDSAPAAPKKRVRPPMGAAPAPKPRGRPRKNPEASPAAEAAEPGAELRVGGEAWCDGERVHVVGQSKAWWSVQFPGSDEIHSRRARELTATASPAAGDDAEEADEALAPALSPDDAAAAEEEAEETLDDMRARAAAPEEAAPPAPAPDDTDDE